MIFEGVEPHLLVAATPGAEQRQGLEGRQEGFGRRGEIVSGAAQVAGRAVRSEDVAVFYETAPAEEVPTGGLDWIGEQVVTNQAGEREEEVDGKLLGDLLDAQVVFLAVGDVPHPLLSLGAGFPPGPDHRAPQSSPFTNAVTVVPPVKKLVSKMCLCSARPKQILKDKETTRARYIIIKYNPQKSD